jgi:hypothetical protein
MPEVDAIKSVMERPLCRNNYIYPRTASRQAIRDVRQAGRQAVGRMGGRVGSSWAAVAVRPYPSRPPIFAAACLPACLPAVPPCLPAVRPCVASVCLHL